MSKLPQEMIAILHAAPRKEAKRAHLLGLINWRLVRGQTFTLDDLLEACRMKVSRRYAARVLDSVVAEEIAVRLSCGAYGPAPGHKKGLRAMILTFAREREGFSRRDLWMGLPVPVGKNAVDRMLRDLIAEGQLQKIGHGRFGLAVSMAMAA